jgi:CDP-glycerol glycerophosphotransferase (TagB/SpsB family)
MIKLFILRKIILPLIFRIYSRKQIDEKMIVFADYRSKELPDNMRFLYERLNSLGYNTVLFLKPKESKNKVTNQWYIFLYFCNFNKYFATAKHVVLTDYFPPLYANSRRPQTKVIQLWHACGAFKKWGYSTLAAGWGISEKAVKKYPIHTNYTHVTVSSKEVIPYYAQAFNMSKKKIFAYGIARTDVFFNSAYKKGAKETIYNVIEKKSQTDKLFDAQGKDFRDKKIILYAPTYRGDNIYSSYNSNVLNVKMLSSFLNEEYLLICKLHPLVASGFKIEDSNKNFVFDVSGDVNISEALCAADVLISDYSSLIFEYSLLERPMIFYAYDMDQYIDSRGFYYDYKEMVPGPIVKDTIQLLSKLENIDEWFDIEKVKRFKEKFMNACDGNSTSRIIDEIFLKEDNKC